MSEQPFYVVFAGVNGAGKSTLFRSDFWRTGGMPATMARVNPDEILREQGGDWSNGQDQVAAGRIALRSVDEHLAARRSFNQETRWPAIEPCAPWPKHARRDTACSCSTSALQTKA